MLSLVLLQCIDRYLQHTAPWWAEWNGLQRVTGVIFGVISSGDINRLVTNQDSYTLQPIRGRRTCNCPLL